VVLSLCESAVVMITLLREIIDKNDERGSTLCSTKLCISSVTTKIMRAVFKRFDK